MNDDLFPGDEQLAKAKILIIDDEETYTRVLEWVLKQSKFSSFRSVTDSSKARAVFEEYQPDLVLLDLFMPNVDGFTLLQEFRELVPPGEYVPVLALTGENTAETRKRALDAGATDFLGKPVDYNEVLLRIRNLLLTRYLHQRVQQLQAKVAKNAPKSGRK